MYSEIHDVIRSIDQRLDHLRKHLTVDEMAHLDEVLRKVLPDIAQHANNEFDLLRQIQPILAPFETIAERREAKGLYRKIFWPAVGIGAFGWILMCLSCFNVKENQWTLVIRTQSILLLYLFILGSLILGRIADIGTTLVGMGAGAVELNPALPKHVNASDILRPSLFQVIWLSLISALILLLHKGAVWVAEQQILEGFIAPRKEIAWAIAGGILAVPSIASFAAAFNNISALTIGSPTKEDAGGSWGTLIAFLFAFGLLVLAGHILSTKENCLAPFDIGTCITWLLVFFATGQGCLSFLMGAKVVARSSWCTAIIIVCAALVWRVALLS